MLSRVAAMTQDAGLMGRPRLLHIHEQVDRGAAGHAPLWSPNTMSGVLSSSPPIEKCYPVVLGMRTTSTHAQ